MSALSEGLNRIHAEAAGACDLIVVQPCDAAGILADALAGDPHAASLLTALNDASEAIVRAPRRASKLCACCPRPLRKGRYSFGLVLPLCDSPTAALAMAVCHRCATERSDIQTKLMGALKVIWPDLRPITVTHQDGGRA